MAALAEADWQGGSCSVKLFDAFVALLFKLDSRRECGAVAFAPWEVLLAFSSLSEDALELLVEAAGKAQWKGGGGDGGGCAGGGNAGGGDLRRLRMDETPSAFIWREPVINST